LVSSTTKRRWKWLIPAIIVVAAIAVVTVIIVQNSSGDAQEADGAGGAAVEQSDDQASAEEDSEADLTQLETRDENDKTAMGDVDAPVGLVMFTDYQCPYCAQWTHDTFPKLKKYVDSGDLRVEWRDVNVFGPESERAAKAAYAAALQDDYYEYHQALFKDGDKRPKSQLSDDALIALADDLGLDKEKFEKDFHSDKVEEEVKNIASFGQSVGVTSTPAFIVGGETVVGAQPTHVFTDLVKKKLAEAKN
jgi:protein-disulfide isomerase